MKMCGTWDVGEEIVHVGKMTLGLLVAVIVCFQLALNTWVISDVTGWMLVLLTSVYLVYTAKPSSLTAAALGAAAILSGLNFVAMTRTLLLGLLLIACGMVMILTQVWWAGVAAGMAKKAAVQPSTMKRPATPKKARKRR